MGLVEFKLSVHFVLLDLPSIFVLFGLKRFFIFYLDLYKVIDVKI